MNFRANDFHHMIKHLINRQKTPFKISYKTVFFPIFLHKTCFWTELCKSCKIVRKSCGAIFLIFSSLFFKNWVLFICTIYFLKFYRSFFERKNKKKEILYMWLPAVWTLFSGLFCAVLRFRAFPVYLCPKFCT